MVASMLKVIRMIEPVHPNFVQQAWPLIGGMLERALQFSGGEYSAEHLRMMLTRGDQVLFVAMEKDKVIGAATVEFMNCPNDRVALITAIAGRLISRPDLFEELKILLRHYGCTKLKGEARSAVARLWHQKFGIEAPRLVVEARL